VLLLRRFLKTFFGQDIGRLSKKYRKAIARAFGVPEEWIREDISIRWATNLAEAFIKPEYWSEFERRRGG